MKFEIFNSEYKMIKSGLTKSQVYHSFIEQKINKDGRFFIRDSYGLDMKFNEFSEFYTI